ncbi:MAG TPA: hypothetical protein VLD67_14975, partial [Vicinamibacterales bacterium]|nr:hypothetical protein [Vicinamibacterales bacterium]
MAEPLEETLRRLEQERSEADRRYNDALTAVDRALPTVAGLPAPVLALDDRQLAPLNDAWNTVPGAPAARGVKGRLAAVVWRVVGRYLQRQLTFNSLLVDHLNRDAAAARQAHRAAEEARSALESRLAGLVEFNARLIGCLQQITPYVDTKDRSAASGAIVLNRAL